MLRALVGLVEMDSTRHRCTHIRNTLGTHTVKRHRCKHILRPAPQPTHRGLTGRKGGGGGGGEDMSILVECKP
jgi:hypothetical protein